MRRAMPVLMVLSFLALAAPAAHAAPPTVTTGSATAITQTSASLNGRVNPRGRATTVSFQYGTTTAYGGQTPLQGPTAAANSSQAVSAPVGALAVGTTYHYRIVATNASGTVVGRDHSFTTLSALSLSARPSSVVIGRTTVLSGRLTGQQPGGVTVSLEENPYPYAGFRQVATVATDGLGGFQFARTPSVNTAYRAVARTRANSTSPTVQIFVQLAVGLRVSRSRLRRAGRVTVSGFASPAHDGHLVLIQRRTRTRHWRTVARTVLQPTGNAFASRFAATLLVRTTSWYRAYVPIDADHAGGTSPAHRVRVAHRRTRHRR